jgi:macrolide transport system ATP-binding/permease protein
METLLQDLRYSVRMFRKSPLFAIVAVVALALGIGANTTIFSLVYALLLRPLPGVEEPQRVVSVFTSDFSSTLYGTSSYPDYIDYRDSNEVFDGLAAYREDSMVLSAGDNPQRIRGAIVSGNYFSVLRGKVLLGRTLVSEDDTAQATNPVVVLSYQNWKQRFGSDPGIIGKTVALNNQGFTVVGIAAESFRGTNLAANVELWLPIAMMSRLQSASALTRRGSRWLRVIGRLKPAVTIEQAQSNIDTIAAQLADAYPQTNRGTLQQPDKARPMSLVPASESATVNPNARATTRRMSQLLMAVAGFVLLIACANVANLLLARAESRRKEVAVRLALGAPRGRLIRQLLTESSLLALMGGAVGLLMSAWMGDLILLFNLPPALDPGLDRWVLGFTLLLSLLTGLLFGLAPAIQASGIDLVSALKDSVEIGNRPVRRFSLRDMLVVSQVALSLLLLIGSGLFLRSLQNAYRTDLGFETRSALLASVDLGLQGYNPAQQRAFNQQIAERLGALPGVQSVSATSFVPVSNGGMRGGVSIEGYQAQPGEDTELNMNTVALNYFQTMGIPLLQGRDFNTQDTESSPRVAIINEAMAQRYWPDQNAISKRISFKGPNGPFTEIVGVAKTGKYRSIGEASLPYIYLPLGQNLAPRLTLIMRTAGDPAELSAALRAEIQAMDRNLPVFDVKTMTEHIGEALSQERLIATMLGIFGSLALVLSTVGIYGLMSYSVSQRRREIGVRMALGARSQDILRLIVSRGLMLTSIGIAIGLAAAIALTRVAGGLLFGISATDPITFAVVSMILAGVALGACFVPARRATKVDPMVALRYE